MGIVSNLTGRRTSHFPAPSVNMIFDITARPHRSRRTVKPKPRLPESRKQQGMVHARKTTSVVAETAARILAPVLPAPDMPAAPVPAPEKRRPRKNLRRKRDKVRRTRPSLSDQLASIGQSAQNLTSSLQQQHGLNGNGVTALLSAPSRHFVVGRLQSKFPSPVKFFQDCVKFSFHHPYEHKVVDMVMYYRDMRGITLNVHQRMLRFRIARRLEQFGSSDYNEHNCRHFIDIYFNSGKDMKQLKEKVLAYMR